MAHTSPADRRDPPEAADEKVMLGAFLDYHRATLLWKVEGLSDADLWRTMTPSGMSLLGMVKHVAYVERWWFQAVFLGEDVYFPQSDTDPNIEWRADPNETTADILNLYRSEAERSRRTLAAANLDDLAKRPQTWPRGGKQTLRWIVLHMIEETARHNGHADLMREAIDGATGE
ncbi:MAG: DinB family protein [Chloroflexota bacterium]